MPFTKEGEFEEQMYHCNYCGEAYFLEEEAEECEQDHDFQMNGYPWELEEEEGIAELKFSHQLLIEHHKEHHEKSEKEIAKGVLDKFVESLPDNDYAMEYWTKILRTVFDWLEEAE